jgi:hypothetical protein
VHPQVYVTHESDIIWILYQIYKDLPDRFRTYPLDEGKGMWATLEWYGETLRSIPPGASNKEAIVQTFYEVLTQINETGRGDWDHPQRKENLEWIGDKKPVQYSDPEIQSFLNSLFPEAHYIHLIRHPRYVVASMLEAANTWGKDSVPEYWKETSQQVLERWTTYEEWVLQAKSRLPDKIHTVRLEDLAADPVHTMSKTFGFLGLDLPSGTEELITEWTVKNPNQRHLSFRMPFSARACQVMESYGYAALD